MKNVSAFLLLSSIFLFAGHLYAQRFQNPHDIVTGQKPISVFKVAAAENNGPTSSADINTFAGNGVGGYDLDGVPATSAALDTPWDVTLDVVGNLYIADNLNNRIRKVDAKTDIITTVAGDGIAGYNGDGESAVAAEVNYPYGVGTDAAGNLYISDSGNYRIRRVDAVTGIITTVAGNGTKGFSGDGGPATDAELAGNVGIALNQKGDLYFADVRNQRVRRVDAATGVITTVAGNGTDGYSGDGGPATAAELGAPWNVKLDTAGNLYISDVGDYCVRKVDASTSIITTVAGNGNQGNTGDGGPATSAEFLYPYGIALDVSGNLYIAEYGANVTSRVRRVDAVTGIITAFAGNGTLGFSGDGGPALNAELSNPTGMTVDANGDLYIADSTNNRIRIVGQTPQHLIATTTTLTAVPTTLVYGQTLTLTATVTPASGGPPTGTVTFYNGSVSLGSAALDSRGVATLTLTPAVGAYSITASYGGSTTDAPSFSTAVAVDVTAATAATTTTTLTASPNPSAFGAAVTLTATVGSSTAIPGGSVSFYDNTGFLAAENLAGGGAKYSTNSLTVGSHNLTAVYGGGNGFNMSTSNVVVEVIVPADFGITASPGSQTIYTGEAVAYIVTIAPGSGFNLPVALSCSQLPANTTCAFSPKTVSGGSQSSILTIQTSAPNHATIGAVMSRKVGEPLLACLFLLFIPRCFSRNRRSKFLVLFVSLVLGGVITGCGGPGTLTGGTPVGAQIVTISGTANNGMQTLTHATSVTLNVKSLF
jgi:sugar lactone lactonase YvrE